MNLRLLATVAWVMASAAAVPSTDSAFALPEAWLAPLTTSAGADFELTSVLGAPVAGTSTAGAWTLELAVFDSTGGRTLDSVAVRLVQRAGRIQILWPAAAEGYHLEATESLSAPDWRRFDGPLETVAGQLVVDLPATGTTRFFRLAR
jgi:hypothetical protein